MKKKILILIPDLGAGGAQKSLVSFLNTLPQDKYSVDVMSVCYLNDFFKAQIPSYVNFIPTPKVFAVSMVSGNSPLFPQYKFGFLVFFKQILFVLKLVYGKFYPCSTAQIGWRCASWFIPKLKQQYDVAISYMDGACNYYVMEKTEARRKILWVHNDYNKMDDLVSFNLPYFKNADQVITISDECRRSLEENFPTIQDKFLVVENITSKEFILKLASLAIPEESEIPENTITLLSIGRLSSQKGFDIAIAAAKELKDRGCKFIWNIIGDGSDREKLQTLIDESDLNNCFKLIGLRKNPYPYIKQSDIFVQPSRFEGKSIVLDEAKIMCRPIVITNYPTAHDSINNGVNGLIVSLDATHIANGIEELIKNRELRESFIAQLSSESNSNESEIEKYIQIIDGN